MKVILLIIMLAVATISCITICSTKKKLNVGDSAPDFSLPDQNGTNHTLSQLRGNNVVLYFYPMDDTPGCTQQACNIRDNFSQFTDANIIVLGLSKGSSKSKLSFATKYSLPFPLLTATKKV